MNIYFGIALFVVLVALILWDRDFFGGGYDEEE